MIIKTENGKIYIDESMVVHAMSYKVSGFCSESDIHGLSVSIVGGISFAIDTKTQSEADDIIDEINEAAKKQKEKKDYATFKDGVEYMHDIFEILK